MFCFSTFQSPANNSINYSCVISWASRDNQRSTCNFIWDIKGSYLFSTRKTFAQVNSRLMEFLMEWLLALGLKEFLVECATVCVKSEVQLYNIYQCKAFYPKYYKNYAYAWFLDKNMKNTLKNRKFSILPWQTKRPHKQQK